MHIMIEISGADYARIKLYKKGHTLYPLSVRLYEAIKHGKPLPKKHGKIIDGDKITEAAMSVKDWYSGGDQHYLEGAKAVLDLIELAKPIIKPESESEEDKE